MLLDSKKQQRANKSLALLLALILCAGCIDQTPLKKAEEASAKVNRAYGVARITGGDWQDELEKQHNTIKHLPQSARIDFFKTVLIECEMFAAKSLNFAELVGNDADALVKELKGFQNSGAFQKLSKEEKQKVTTWVYHLEVLPDGNDVSEKK